MRIFSAIVILLIGTLLISTTLGARDLEEGKVYRLQKTINDMALARDKQQTFVAAKESKFLVLDASAGDHYIVRFLTIYNFEQADGSILESTIRKDEEYLLEKRPGNVPIEKSVILSRGGAVSGPLIVPFKYRLDSDTLSGEAAIGYYAGYSIEPKIPWTETRIPISPFIAGGLTPVSVADEDETSNRTGVTVAVGILVQNWAGVNIGIVYGEDRIGDSDWEHEGEEWISFMVGWEL